MLAETLCSYAHCLPDGEVTPFSCAFLAELPLIDLMKLYEGAFLPSFQWPQPQPGGEETSEEEGGSRACRGFSLQTAQCRAGLGQHRHPFVW